MCKLSAVALVVYCASGFGIQACAGERVLCAWRGDANLGLAAEPLQRKT